MTTYYVSSLIGADNNAGTSASAPLATLQDAANLVKPGDTVLVMNGTYTGPSGGTVLSITTSGTASAPITFQAAPGQTPVIDSSGTWNGINIESSYIVINGFTVKGDAGNYTLSQALAGYSTGNPNLDGNGIVVNSPGGGVIPNHITIENNTVYNEPGGGIGTQGADYVQILNNVVHDNAHWSAFGNSGISVNISANLDTKAGPHIVISGNTSFNNTQLVPSDGAGRITDGEGIILDSNSGYTGGFLVQNNTTYGNSGPGIESFLSDNAVITGNTVYGNVTNSGLASAGATQILINQSNNDTVSNNTTTAPNTAPPPAPVVSGDTVGFGNAVTVTGTAQALTTVTVFDNSTQLGTAVTNSSGVWTFTTAPLANGNQSFTATATDSLGHVSALSSPLVVALNLPVNLVTNGSFATGDFTGWTLGGNYTSPTVGAEIYIVNNGAGGSTTAAGIGSMGADGTLTQTIATTPGQTYTLSFWLQSEGSGGNDFAAIWNGQKLVSLTNATQSGYTEYTYTVAATGSTSTLQFSAANSPSQWDLDNISLTATGGTAPGGTAPAAPAIASFTTDTGVAGDHITNDSTPTLTGTAVANSTVTVFDGTTKLGTTTANSSGAWSFTSAKLTDGGHSFTATDTVSGATSAASAALALTIDSVAPNAPVEAGDSISSGNQVILNGTAEAGSTVKVYDGTTQVGTATVAANGSWTVTTSALSVGSHNLTATATDAAGNVSAVSAPLDPVISAPVTPGVPTIASFSTDSGVVGDHITNDNTLTLTGTAVANSTVKVFDGATQVGTATANSGGVWTLTTAKLADGGHSFTATDTVSGGAASAASSALSVTVDSVAPGAPNLVSDAIVNTNHVLLSGTAAANTTLQVFDGTSQIGTATASSSGTWTLTTGALASGIHSFTAEATDAAGNSSAVSTALSATIPAAGSTSGAGSAAGQNLVVNGNFATGDFSGWTLGGNYTSSAYGNEIYIVANATGGSAHAAGIGSIDVDGTLSQTVKTTAGQTYTLSFWLQNEGSGANDFAALWNGQKLVSTTNAAKFGYTEYTYTVTATGSTSTLQFSAANGPSQWDLDNISLTATNGTSTTTGGTPPVAPAIASFSTDSGVAGDHITNDNTLILSGTAVANSTVTLFDGTTKLGTASANGSGAWTYTTSALIDGNHSLTATDTSSGQTSSASSALVVTVDTHAPTAPTMTINSQGGTAVAAGSATAVDDFLLKGTAEANSTISVFDGGKQIGTTSANSSGAWSLDTGVLSNGSHSFTSTATDVAGSASAASAAKGLTVVASTVIESFGSTSLVEVGNNFYLNGNSTGTGPELKYAGAAVTAGEFGATTPIGVEQTATGYEVAWKVTGSDRYTIWNTDSNGTFLSKVVNGVSGTNATLESLETSFHQDLNGDGTIGLPTTVIESLGSTSLVEVGNNFYLNGNSTGTGPELKYAGAAVTAGEFGATTPIGVEQTATGYEVAWKVTGSDQYTIWNTDSNGNFLSKVVSGVSGTNATLETLETSFHQDLNGDGATGTAATMAAAATPKIGLTDLSESAQGLVTMNGTADAGSQVKVYDGTQAMGTVTAGTNGTWSLTSSSAASNTVHTYMAQELDSAGHVVGSSGNAILGATGANTLTSTGGNNLFVGNGNADTFVFASNFGNDVIKDFNANNTSSSHDVIQFSKSVFDSFADVLAHATQSGQNVVIADGHGDSLTLKNIKLSALDTHDFHFA